MAIKFTQRGSDLEKDAEREGEGDGHEEPAEAKQEPAKHSDARVGVLSIICKWCQYYFAPTVVHPVTLSTRLNLFDVNSLRAQLSFSSLPFLVLTLSTLKAYSKQLSLYFIRQEEPLKYFL